MSLQSSDLCLVNVYAPYCCPQNRDAFDEYLGNLKIFCEDLNSSNLALIGDFNAGHSNAFGDIVSNFCEDLEFVGSDTSFLPNDSFTYLSPAHGTTTWIDHVVSSHGFHQSIVDIQILHNYIISDHRPLLVVIECSSLAGLNNVEPDEHATEKVKWQKVSQTQKENYCEMTKMILAQIPPPFETLECRDFTCTCLLYTSPSPRDA